MAGMMEIAYFAIPSLYKKWGLKWLKSPISPPQMSLKHVFLVLFHGTLWTISYKTPKLDIFSGILENFERKRVNFCQKWDRELQIAKTGILRP